MANIMIVEDDPLIGDDIKHFLLKAGHNVTSCEVRGEVVLTKIGIDKPDVILMDIRLAGSFDGIELAAIIKHRYKVPVIYITAYSNEEYIRRAKTTDPVDYIIKPFDESDLLKSIEKALNK